MGAETGLLFRYRVTFAKGGGWRWVGHLDLQRGWLRLLRRAALPVALSAGYHPHPRLVFAATLPLGCFSREELLDVWLRELRAPEALLASLQRVAPPGIEIFDVTPIALEAPKLPTLVRTAVYKVELGPELAAQLRPRLVALLEATTLIRERRGRSYDLRPLIEQLELATDENVLRMSLVAQPSATGRPDEVLRALDVDPALATITRQRLQLTPWPTPAEAETAETKTAETTWGSGPHVTIA